MKVELASGTVYTSKVSASQNANLLAVISLVDNCLEDGDIDGLVDSHDVIRKWMRDLGMKPNIERTRRASDGGS